MHVTLDNQSNYFLELNSLIHIAISCSQNVFKFLHIIENYQQ